MFLVLYILLVVGILLNGYLGDWFLGSLKNSKVSYIIVVVGKILNVILDEVFFHKGTSYSTCYS